MLNNLYSYFSSKPEQSVVTSSDAVNNETPSQRSERSERSELNEMKKATNVTAPRFDTQYRGSCLLVNGKAYVEFATSAKNAQVHLCNATGWDLVKVESRDTLSSGHFTVVSNAPESSSIIEWLVIADKNVVTRVERPKTEPVETKETKKPIHTSVGSLQRDIFAELMQKVNTKTLEYKSPPIEEKKKEETPFQKELKEKKSFIMRRNKNRKKND